MKTMAIPGILAASPDNLNHGCPVCQCSSLLSK